VAKIDEIKNFIHWFFICPMHLQHWTDYKISLFCVSASLSHKRAERSTGLNFPPMFTKLAIKVESHDMFLMEIWNIHVRQNKS